MKIPTKIRRIGIDAAGYTMILTGIAIGWLPGPGFTPLFLGGLALLSIHNPWARRLREYALKNGTSLMNAFFPDHRLIMWLWDIAVALAIAIGAYALYGLSGFLKTVVSAVFLAGALIAFARNRRRFERAVNRLKRKR